MRLSRPSVPSAKFLRDPVTRRYLGIAGAACMVDLLTKEVAVRVLGDHGVVSLTERLSLTLVWNTGAAGGVSMGPYTWLINVVVTVLALGLVLSVVRQMAAVDPRATMALGLVSGGAVGNLLSIMAGPFGVADFIGIRLTADTTMVANVADFFLWAGSLMLAPVGAKLVRLARAERAQRMAPRAMPVDIELA
ncbi:signal peptidase II [Gemmatimonas phototrophica]|uniref:signal peptidase II n=1 Tax=Gemmatimonas phototrophica TaxID=1379270 RepID=UPI0009EE7B98|nr:signal peptidase II [Gemmatimonas phototrophica]